MGIWDLWQEKGPWPGWGGGELLKGVWESLEDGKEEMWATGPVVGQQPSSSRRLGQREGEGTRTCADILTV